MIKHLLVIFCFISFIYMDEENEIKPMKLGDMPFNRKMENLNVIPDMRQEDLFITDYEIKGIKLKSKNYEPAPISENDLVFINTNRGTMKFRLYNNEAPNHCYNFKKLANSNFYDGTLFHMVIPNFLVQGGDILSRDSDPDNDGTGGPGWTINQEFNSISHKKGILSMSRSREDMNSAGSQFFITLVNAPHLDSSYTVFGEMIEGQNVLSRISNMSSDHDNAIKLSTHSIPENEKIEDWVEIINPLKDETRYCKIPEHLDKESFKKAMQTKIDNIYTPGAPIIIDSIRVITENDKK